MKTTTTVKALFTTAISLIVMVIVLLACPEAIISKPLQDLKQLRIRESIFSDVPHFTLDEKGNEATLSLTTRIATPPISVHFGFVFPGQGITIPSYGKTSLESSKGEERKDHSLKLSIHNLRKIVDRTLLQKDGIDVYYLIELWNREKQCADYYEGRHRFKEEEGKLRIISTVVEGPFIDVVTHSSAIVSWTTDTPAEGEVILGGKSYRDNKKALSHEIRLGSLTADAHYEYTVRVINGRDSFSLPTYYFKTTPMPGSKRKFRFTFMSDSRAGEGGGLEDFGGFNRPVLRSLFLSSYKEGSKFILFAGDLVDGYCSEQIDLRKQFHQWKITTEPFGHYVPIYESIGNHEFTGDVYEVRTGEKTLQYYSDRTDKNSMEAVMADEFVNPDESYPEPETINGIKGPDYKETVYSFDFANSHFAVMNSNYWYTGVANTYDREITAHALRILGGNRDGYIRKNQMKWLERDLESARKRNMENIFVILHEPPFPNGGHQDSAMFWGMKKEGTWTGLNDPSQPCGDVIDMRRQFLEIISRNNVLAVLSGHEHNYSRMIMDDSIEKALKTPIWQIISGSAGAPYVYNQALDLPWSRKVKVFSPASEYCLFDVEGDKVSLTVYSPTGEEIDKVHDMKRELQSR